MVRTWGLFETAMVNAAITGDPSYAEYAQYLSELEQSRVLNDSVIITEDDNKIISSDAQPLRNEAGFFLAVEDPYEDNVNLKDPDQLIKLESKTTTYVYDPYWSLIIDRDFKEL